MNKFQPQRGAEIVETSREASFGGGESVFYKSTPAADMSDVNSRLTDRTDHGKLQELAHRITEIHQRAVAHHGGVTALSLDERKAIFDQIIAAMSQTNGSPFPNDKFVPTPALIAIARLLAGLTDELEVTEPANKHTKTYGSDPFVELRSQIDRVTKQINALAATTEGRANSSVSAKFKPDGVEKSDVASQELRKALANGKPAAWE